MWKRVLLLGLASHVCLGVEKEGDDPLQWLRDSIPGEPGVDYPIFNEVQESAFSCDGRIFGGYYADVEQGCQAFHVCLQEPNTDKLFKQSFLCPNGTLFQQQIFNCDWWYNVDCASSENYYNLVEGAFASAAGSGAAGGSCPAASEKSDEECAGKFSQCWSPGQNDGDCPNFGLCCFDGCANTCVDKPETDSGSKPVPQVTTLRPKPAPTTQRPAAAPPATTVGYDYPVPEVTLAVRPVAQTTQPPASPPVTQPPALYGAPAPPRRQGKRGRRLKKRKVRKVQPEDEVANE